MSLAGNPSLSLNSAAPLWRSQYYVDNLTDRVSSYWHELRAIGGYASAQFSLTDNLENLEGWLQDGLGRDITCAGDGLDVLYNGFVNQISLTAGNYTHILGPLVGIANRNNLWYSPLDTTVVPPAVGTSTALGWLDDLASQARYGIWEQVWDVGQATDLEAAQLAQMYLDRYALPERDQSGTADGPASLTVDCLGYAAFFNAYTYVTGAGGTINLSTQIANVLAAQNNAIFNSSTKRITTNTFQVSDYAADNERAWSFLTKLVSLGDATYNRYLLGVYENQQLVYEAAPTTVEYYQRLRDPGRRVEDVNGNVVLPWNVRAGKWLLHPDFLVGRVPPETPAADDPRAAFLECVRFTAPAGLTWQSGRTRRIDQKLAQRGLSTVGGY